MPENVVPIPAGILRRLREWIATEISLVLAIVVLLNASFTKFNFINLPFVSRIPAEWFDDVVVSILLICAGLFFDRSNRRKRHQSEVSEQRLRVFKATMRTVQHIVNNLLNTLELFRLEAEGALPDKTLKEMDQLVEHAAKEIRALGNLDVVIEKPMAGGTGIEYRSNTNPRLAAQD